VRNNLDLLQRHCAFATYQSLYYEHSFIVQTNMNTNQIVKKG